METADNKPKAAQPTEDKALTFKALAHASEQQKDALHGLLKEYIKEFRTMVQRTSGRPDEEDEQ